MTTGQQLRDQGTADVIAADTAAHRNVGRFIKAAIADLADSGQTFSAEDVRSMLPEDAIPHSHNLIPAYMGGAASAGQIEAVGMCKTTRVSRRSSRNLVWRGTH